MSTCFLFGHANTPRSAYPALVEAIENEISKGTKIFYVGYHGNFDRMAIAALRLAKQKHDIVAALVLPYHPAAYHIEKPDGFDMILYPPLESVLQNMLLYEQINIWSGLLVILFATFAILGTAETFWNMPNAIVRQ